MAEPISATESQLTSGPGGRVLTNAAVWSPDSEWILYDTRSDAAGNLFDGSRIEMVNARTGEVRLLYESKNGAHCGVATFHPFEPKIVFILGPEYPTADWEYSASHRQGVMIDLRDPGRAINLDARDLTPPFTPGALRGGSHVHVWHPRGDWVNFTYNDALCESTVRDIGVSIPHPPVRVPKTHPRNHDGEFFSALVTRTVARPKPGSDEISRACEEGWIGTNGYLRPDGSRQKRALAFQGTVRTSKGETISEVFIVDLPDNLTIAGDGPLQGTQTQRPSPPLGTVQRRLTFTAEFKFPGLQGPRHWLRSPPDGSQIALLLKDEKGIVQLWIISPNGGNPSQVTHNLTDIGSAFTWSSDGRYIAHVFDNSVALTEVTSGRTIPLTDRSDDAAAPRPEACVFSPDGKKIAYVRQAPSPGGPSNQIFVATLQ